MARKTTSRTPSEDEAFAEITSIQPAGDRVRFAAINHASSFSAAKKKSLLRQEKAAVARYGPNAPQAAVFRQRVLSEERFAVAVQAEGQRAQVEPLQRNPEALTMRGRVVNSQRVGIAKLTVSAIDTQGKAAASAVSSATGYYEFLVPVRNRDAPDTVTLLVSDSAQNVRFRGCECFEVKARAVITRELVLGSAEPITQPTPPPDVDPKKVTVPDVQGLKRRDAELQLRALCLKPEVITSETAPDKVGKVIKQDPAPGATVPLASEVTITVGVPGATVTVPDLVGLTQDEASAKLEEAGLALGPVETEPTGGNQVGSVLRQEPKAGAQVPPGSAVNIVIGSEPALVTVPNVVGQTVGRARATIVNANLKLGKFEPANAPLRSVVIEQKPAAGSQVAPGTAIDLQLRVEDTPPRDVTVPDLVNLTLAEARIVLKDTGLKEGGISPEGAPPSSIVIEQKPEASTPAAVGSPVKLTVKAEERKRGRPAPKKVAAKKTTKKAAKKARKKGRSKGDNE